MELRHTNSILIEQSAQLHTKETIKWIADSSLTMEKWDKLCSILIELQASDLLDRIYSLNNE